LFGSFAEESFDHLLDLRDSSRSADEHDLFDVLRLESGVLDRLFDRRHQSLEQRLDELFELRTRKLHYKMLRPGSVSRDEGQVDLGFHRR
jgi:hypothetical protein